MNESNALVTHWKAAAQAFQKICWLWSDEAIMKPFMMHE
jgi:hypothetical protein